MEKEKILDLIEKDFEFKRKIIELLYEDILENLPDLLKKRPQLKDRLLQEVIDILPTKQDLIAILQELKNQREDTNRMFEEINNRFEIFMKETNKRFEEINQRFEAFMKETTKRFEEIEKRFEAFMKETSKRFEEINQRFEKVDKRFEELIKEMREGFKALRDLISAVGARWGILAEKAFREAMKDILERLGFYKVDKWTIYDEAGFVFGYSCMIEVDIAIVDNKHYLIEIKSSVSDGDVLKLKKIGEFYEKQTKIKPNLIFISPFVTEEAKEKCNIWGIKFYTS